MSEQLKAHREYLDGCEKRALSKLQATREVLKAARALVADADEDGTIQGEFWIGEEFVDALRDALAKLDEAER